MYDKVSSFPFIFALILVWIYFWLNGPAHFINWSDSYGGLMLTYLAMLVIFLFFAKIHTERQMHQPISQSMLAFVMFFIITAIILNILILAGAFTPPAFDTSLFWPTLIIQIFVVATAEELMFRGVLLPYVGIVIQAILFAVWHSYAYQITWYNLTWSTLNWPAVLMAFIMGLLLGVIAKQKRLGIAACIGLHGAWNCTILGMLSL